MMSTYYTVLTAISCFILIVLGLLVMENDRIEKSDKNKFYLTYLLIAAAAVFEYAAVYLNGASSSYKGIHAVMKSMDYVLTPMIGLLFVRQLADRWNRIQRCALSIIAANAFVAFLSIFTGWYFYLDETNVYHHGPLYFLYIAVYIFILVFAMIEFLFYARRFARQHIASIHGIWFFMLLFITLQQFVDSNIRVVYLIMSVSCVMIFAHCCQYRLQESTETITHQQSLLERDPLTNLYSRFSYIQTLENYERRGTAPPELIAISIDINGLKKVNDSQGHQAGDALICSAARIILNTFDGYGKCYRTGGDEFIVFLDLPRSEKPKPHCEKLIASLHTAASSRKGEFISSVSLSCGYAAAQDYPDLSVEKLVSIADAYMYEDKKSYYSHYDAD